MTKRLPLGRLVATALVAFLIAALAPQTLHRRAFDHAYFAYHQNPSPENEELLKREQTKQDRVWMMILTVEAVVIFTALNGVWMLGQRVLRPRTQ